MKPTTKAEFAKTPTMHVDVNDIRNVGIIAHIDAGLYIVDLIFNYI
jgi:hypothetical protein